MQPASPPATGARIATLAVHPPLIQLESVRKAFRTPDGRQFEAVKETTLAVERGDIFGLVGRSGAGKSTLLRLVNLLERPDAGRVLVAGRDLTALDKSALREARQGIGMIFQQFNLLQNATVFDNVAFPLRIHGRHATAARIDARVRKSAWRWSTSPDKIRRVTRPSFRVDRSSALPLLARWRAQPAVLLCDEPTSALDAETTESLLATLRDINASLGVTIVIVTHELSVVTSLCRHVAVVEDGAIAERFALEDSARSAAFVPATRLGRDLLRLQDAARAERALDVKEAARA